MGHHAGIWLDGYGMAKLDDTATASWVDLAERRALVRSGDCVTGMREGMSVLAMLVQQNLAEDPFRWQFQLLARHIEVPTLEIRQPFQSLA